MRRDASRGWSGGAVPGDALGFDVLARRDELFGSQARGQVLAAEQPCRRPAAAERVRREDDRSRVPRGLFDGVDLSVEVELLVLEVRTRPVTAAVGPQELHPGEQLPRVLI